MHSPKARTCYYTTLCTTTANTDPPSPPTSRKDKPAVIVCTAFGDVLGVNGIVNGVSAVQLRITMHVAGEGGVPSSLAWMLLSCRCRVTSSRVGAVSRPLVLAPHHVLSCRRRVRLYPKHPPDPQESDPTLPNLIQLTHLDPVPNPTLPIQLCQTPHRRIPPHQERTTPPSFCTGSNEALQSPSSDTQCPNPRAPK